MRNRWIAFVAAVACLVTAGHSRAEASVPTCTNQWIAEVFGGSASCPAAQYVLIRVPTQVAPWEFGQHSLVTEDRCGSYLGDFGSWATPDAGPQEQTFLVATPQAQELFGIQADVVTQRPVVPMNGRVEFHCGSGAQFVSYGAHASSAGVPALQPGLALKKTATGWELGQPAPANSKGEQGVLGSCSPASHAVPRDDPDPQCVAQDGGTQPANDGGPQTDGGLQIDGGPPDADATPSPGAGSSDGCALRPAQPHTPGSELAALLFAFVCAWRRKNTVNGSPLGC